MERFAARDESREREKRCARLRLVLVRERDGGVRWEGAGEVTAWRRGGSDEDAPALPVLLEVIVRWSKAGSGNG